MPSPKRVSVLTTLSDAIRDNVARLKWLWLDAGNDDENTAFIARKVSPQTVVDMAATLDATKLTGVVPVESIPVLFSGIQVFSDGDIEDLSSGQQSAVKKGAIVTTTDGRRWVYSGTGDKLDEENYVELADVTPHWDVIAGKPSEFPPEAAALAAAIAESKLVVERAEVDSTTLLLTDVDKLVSVEHADAKTWTIPPDGDVDFPIGAQVSGAQYGAGAVTITPGAGVTVDSFGGALISAGPNATWTAWKRSANVWKVVGNLVS